VDRQQDRRLVGRPDRPFVAGGKGRSGDACRVGTVGDAASVDAALAAAQARAFRQLLWPRLAVLAVVWLGVAATWLSRTALVVGLGLFAAVAIWAVSFERRARRRLEASPAEAVDSRRAS
jgi:hypothetical protein